MSRAFHSVREIGRQLIGGKPIGRNLSLFPDDVFITSYPRSGNTWTRFLIGNLIYPDGSLSFNNIEQRVPEIHAHSDRAMRRLRRPRVLKSHEPFEPAIGESYTSSVIRTMWQFPSITTTL
jgi:hypothetical protein